MPACWFLSFLFYVVVCCLGINGLWFWTAGTRISGLPKWKRLSVTWLDYRDLPLLESEAKTLGWKKDRAGCADSPSFRGTRYRLHNDTSTMLLFDSQGLVAGIQTAVPKDTRVQKNTKMSFVNVNELFHLTAYFTDPELICAVTRKRDRGYVGEKLLLQLGSDWRYTMKIPVNENELLRTRWVEGKCFWSMGRHYWYDMSTAPGSSGNCSDPFPAFTIYNNGKLTGFGWLIASHVMSSSYEHPKPGSLKMLLPDHRHASCLSTMNITTQHIFLNEAPYLSRC